MIMPAKLVDCLFDNEYPLPDKDHITVGRAQTNDIVIPQGQSREYMRGAPLSDPKMQIYLSMSRAHAVVDRKDGDYVIIDCNSTQGTHVNDAPISGATKLTNGCKIKLGVYPLTFVME